MRFTVAAVAFGLVAGVTAIPARDLPPGDHADPQSLERRPDDNLVERAANRGFPGPAVDRPPPHAYPTPDVIYPVPGNRRPEAKAPGRARETSRSRPVIADKSQQAVQKAAEKAAEQAAEQAQQVAFQAAWEELERAFSKGFEEALRKPKKLPKELPVCKPLKDPKEAPVKGYKGPKGEDRQRVSLKGSDRLKEVDNKKTEASDPKKRPDRQPSPGKDIDCKAPGRWFSRLKNWIFRNSDDCDDEIPRPCRLPGQSTEEVQELIKNTQKERARQLHDMPSNEPKKQLKKQPKPQPKIDPTGKHRGPHDVDPFDPFDPKEYGIEIEPGHFEKMKPGIPKHRPGLERPRPGAKKPTQGPKTLSFDGGADVLDQGDRDQKRRPHWTRDYDVDDATTALDVAEVAAAPEPHLGKRSSFFDDRPDNYGPSDFNYWDDLEYDDEPEFRPRPIGRGGRVPDNSRFKPKENYRLPNEKIHNPWAFEPEKKPSGETPWGRYAPDEPRRKEFDTPFQWEPEYPERRPARLSRPGRFPNFRPDYDFQPEEDDRRSDFDSPFRRLRDPDDFPRIPEDDRRFHGPNGFPRKSQEDDRRPDFDTPAPTWRSPGDSPRNRQPGHSRERSERPESPFGDYPTDFQDRRQDEFQDRFPDEFEDYFQDDFQDRFQDEFEDRFQDEVNDDFGHFQPRPPARGPDRPRDPSNYQYKPKDNDKGDRTRTILPLLPSHPPQSPGKFQERPHQPEDFEDVAYPRPPQHGPPLSQKPRPTPRPTPRPVPDFKSPQYAPSYEYHPAPDPEDFGEPHELDQDTVCRLVCDKPTCRMECTTPGFVEYTDEDEPEREPRPRHQYKPKYKPEPKPDCRPECQRPEFKKRLDCQKPQCQAPRPPKSGCRPECEMAGYEKAPECQKPQCQKKKPDCQKPQCNMAGLKQKPDFRRPGVRESDNKEEKRPEEKPQDSPPQDESQKDKSQQEKPQETKPERTTPQPQPTRTGKKEKAYFTGTPSSDDPSNREKKYTSAAERKTGAPRPLITQQPVAEETTQLQRPAIWVDYPGGARERRRPDRKKNNDGRKAPAIGDSKDLPLSVIWPGTDASPRERKYYEALKKEQQAKQGANPPVAGRDDEHVEEVNEKGDVQKAVKAANDAEERPSVIPGKNITVVPTAVLAQKRSNLDRRLEFESFVGKSGGKSPVDARGAKGEEDDKDCGCGQKNKVDARGDKDEDKDCGCGQKNKVDLDTRGGCGCGKDEQGKPIKQDKDGDGDCDCGSEDCCCDDDDEKPETRDSEACKRCRKKCRRCRKAKGKAQLMTHPLRKGQKVGLGAEWNRGRWAVVE